MSTYLSKCCRARVTSTDNSYCCSRCNKKCTEVIISRKRQRRVK